MNGITGWYAPEDDLSLKTEIVSQMIATLRHRGPASQDTWHSEHMALGAATQTSDGDALPVVDLGAHSAAISFDGELNNRSQLLQNLSGDGLEAIGETHAVLALRAYLKWGLSFVDHLAGGYALGIWDSRDDRLVLVRDRLGVKPLYIHQRHGEVLFGSEIKALLAHPEVPRRVTKDGLREVFEMVKTPGQAVFDQIEELKPGTLLVADPTGVRTRTYWKLEAREHGEDLQSTIDHTRVLLDDIISEQSTATESMGSMVSGGLDSSLITAIAAQFRENDPALTTFSVDFVQHTEEFIPDPVRGTPDAPFVKELVDQVGTNHHFIEIPSHQMADPSLRSKIISAIDLPPAFWGDMWPSLYLFFQEVRKHASVTLSGESADEVFSGYRWFYDPDAVQADTFPWLTSVTEKYFDGKPLFSQRFLTSLSLDEFVADSYRTALNEVPRLDGENATERRMREMSYVNLTRFVQTLLDRMDRMSQAHALQVRAPFADHRLVEYAFNIPWEYKSFDGREKSILRAATKDVVPGSILERKKSPYPSTQDPSYEEALREQLRELTQNPDSPVLPLLDTNAVDELLKTPLGEVSPMYDRMGTELVVGINSWLQQYDISLDLD